MEVRGGRSGIVWDVEFDDDPAAGAVYIRDESGTGRAVADVNVRGLGVPAALAVAEMMAQGPRLLRALWSLFDADTYWVDSAIERADDGDDGAAALVTAITNARDVLKSLQNRIDEILPENLQDPGRKDDR